MSLPTAPRRPSQPARAVRERRARVPSRVSSSDLIHRIRGGGTWALIGVIALLAIYNLYDPIRILLEQQVQLASLHAEVKKAEQTLAESQANIERWRDRAYIEAQARQRLMFVYPGDISYLVVNDVNPQTTTAQKAESEVTATSIDWVDAFLKSYAFSATAGEHTK